MVNMKFSWKAVGIFFCGLLWGVALTYLIAGVLIKKFIVLEYKSAFSVEETGRKIAENANRTGVWLAKLSLCSLPQPEDGTAINVVTLCNAKIAKGIVDDYDSRCLSSVIPCQFAIYQKSDGSVAVSRLNFSLIGYMFGGRASELASRAVKEQDEIMEGILKD